jgi:hypothetical protein
VLLKSNIPTPDQMVQIDKEVERQKSELEKSKSSLEWSKPIRIEACEEDSSSASMPMYKFDSDREDSNGPSNQSPTIVIHDAPLPMHLKEVHSSPIMEKVLCERHSTEDRYAKLSIKRIHGEKPIFIF